MFAREQINKMLYLITLIQRLNLVLFIFEKIISILGLMNLHSDWSYKTKQLTYNQSKRFIQKSIADLLRPSL